MSKTLILTSSGLKNLVSDVEQKEFEFIFGQQRVSMKNLFAEFISPIVSRLHQTDPTINCVSFNENFKDITLSENSISKFNFLSKGETIIINEEESLEMKIISIFIENEELFNKLNDLYPSEINETNIDHYLSNLTFFSQLSPSFKYFNYSNIIDAISSHFYSIDKKKLKQVPKSILYSIICNSNLHLKNEDSLLDFLNDVLKEDEPDSILCFYEEVEYSMLSENKFLEFINKFDSSKMTQNLWSKLRRCFYINKKQCINEVNENRYQTQNIKNRLKENNKIQFTGNIIEHLTKEVGGNVHDKGVVNVTSSSINKNSFAEAKNAVDINNNDYFFSGGEQNPWLKYDFINRKVLPTGYSITTKNRFNAHHPKNWVIEGSNNDKDWVILDTRNNDTSLNGLNVTGTFDIESQDESYRYLRIRQTGKNSSNLQYLSFSSLEFIGSILDDDL